jgi:ABC-type lipoprotein release transport system permease subunit
MGHFIVLAFKNVFRQKKRSFTLGVNYAVVAFILVLLLAFSQGASVNIADSLVKATAGHITITGQFAKGGKIYNGLSRTPDIVSAVTDTYGDAKVLVRYLIRSTLYFNGLSKRLSFTGIDTEKDPTFQDQAVFKNPPRDGSWTGFAQDPNGVLMPQETADYFGLKLGDQVVLSTRTRFGAFNTGILTVRGIYRTDNYFARDLVLTHFDFLRNLDLADPTASTAVYVYFPRMENLSAKRDSIDRALKAKGFDVSVPASDGGHCGRLSGQSEVRNRQRGSVSGDVEGGNPGRGIRVSPDHFSRRERRGGPYFPGHALHYRRLYFYQPPVQI